MINDPKESVRRKWDKSSMGVHLIPGSIYKPWDYGTRSELTVFQYMNKIKRLVTKRCSLVVICFVFLTPHFRFSVRRSAKVIKGVWCFSAASLSKF